MSLTTDREKDGTGETLVIDMIRKVTGLSKGKMTSRMETYDLEKKNRGKLSDRGGGQSMDDLSVVSV